MELLHAGNAYWPFLGYGFLFRVPVRQCFCHLLASHKWFAVLLPHNTSPPHPDWLASLFPASGTLQFIACPAAAVVAVCAAAAIASRAANVDGPYLTFVDAEMLAAHKKPSGLTDGGGNENGHCGEHDEHKVTIGGGGFDEAGREAVQSIGGASSDVVIDVLRPVDAAAVVAAWPYSGRVPLCQNVVEDCVRHRPSACARLGGNLVGLAFTRHDGSVGMVHTEQLARRRGF